MKDESYTIKSVRGFWTLEEACAICGISIGTIMRDIALKRLKVVKERVSGAAHGRTLVPQSNLVDYKASRETNRR